MQPTTGLSWLSLKSGSDRARSLPLFLLLMPPMLARDFQRDPVSADLLVRVKSLYEEGSWDTIVKLLPASRDYPADMDYYRGMALAGTHRWDEAREAFEAGQNKNRADKRFPLELAGVAFKQGRLFEARSHLRRALNLDPGDSYANDFLATLFLLDQNLEASLKYWNRIGKPFLETVTTPALLVRAAILDRAFAFSPASILRLDDLLTTRSRLNSMEIFPRFRFELVPRPDNKFDLAFRCVERNGLGNSWLEGLLSLFRGIPYQTVHPEFFNLKGSAVNWVSLVRFDAQKRRLYSSLSGPLGADPKWRYRVYVDGRKENWDVSRTSRSPALAAGDIALQSVSGGAEIQSTVNGLWRWKSGLSLTHRKFRRATPETEIDGSLFTQGFSLKNHLRVDRQLFLVPERRLSVNLFANWELAKILAGPHDAFARVRGGLELQWHPFARGDDYTVTGRFGAGKTLGRAPFDELFNLGQERDTDLFLRGHRGTRAGKKGNSPLGRDYLLWNWEFDRVVYAHSRFDLRLGPVIDTGRVYDRFGNFGSEKWLWDAGIQARVRIQNRLTLILTIGKDLRSGREAFHFNAAR